MELRANLTRQEHANKVCFHVCVYCMYAQLTCTVLTEKNGDGKKCGRAAAARRIDKAESKLRKLCSFFLVRRFLLFCCWCFLLLYHCCAQKFALTSSLTLSIFLSVSHSCFQSKVLQSFSQATFRPQYTNEI